MAIKKTRVAYSIAGILVFALLYIYGQPLLIREMNNKESDDLLLQTASARKVKKGKTAPAPVVGQPSGATFNADFNSEYTVEETGSNSNDTWWISSGAYLYSGNGIASTIKGELSALNRWRIAYASSNTTDTDGGYHPQNIFRLVLNSKWLNFQQQAYFRIVKDNLSTSPNRNASNGLFFFNRYQDQNTIYYTGIRVDGYAVIKKKLNGNYYTMAYKALPNITGTYDATNNPDMLPKNTWIGMKSEVQTNSDNTVSVRLYADLNETGTWQLVAEAKDDNKSFGGSTIADAGSAGIRTDFMDVEFKNYSIQEK